MPAYNYHCPKCNTDDLRIAGIDDHRALCVNCGDIMLRTDKDIWAKLWNNLPADTITEGRVCAWCHPGEPSGSGVSHGICERHRDEMLKEAGQCG